MSELLRGEPAGVPRARMMLQRAHWAASAFASYSPDAVSRIVEAVSETAYQNAERYAEWAVRETGMGVIEHKRIKNEVCSRGIAETYRDHDYVSARIDEERRIVEVPRPAGVVLALTPSTNPVSSVYFKVLLSLLTRNAVVVSPHPMARECCVDATRLLADAAVRAGAPDGCIQVVEEPTIPLIEALMSDVTTDVIVATAWGPATSPCSSTRPRTSCAPRVASSTRRPSTTRSSARTSRC
jgi:acyl-CoA reductase-like NAD-dependent aldehyde dehydrogenase